MRYADMKNSAQDQGIHTLPTRPTAPSSEPQGHPSTAGDVTSGRQLSVVASRTQEPSTRVKHDTSSETLTCSKPRNCLEPTKGTESTKVTTPKHDLTREPDDAEWDLVTQEHEQDDVAFIAVLSESEEDFEHLEASGGEEDYDNVRMRSGPGKLCAFRNLALYGPK